MFLQWVNEVYQVKGKEFAEVYRNHTWPAQSENHYLDEMEEIVPGVPDLNYLLLPERNIQKDQGNDSAQ